MATLNLTEKQLNQVFMGLSARIEELYGLIEANRDNDAAVEDWQLQLEDARNALAIVGRA